MLDVVFVQRGPIRKDREFSSACLKCSDRLSPTEIGYELKQYGMIMKIVTWRSSSVFSGGRCQTNCQKSFEPPDLRTKYIRHVHHG